jgi:hypothetical protein
MADKKLAMDKVGLQDFVDNQIVPFKDSLVTVSTKDAPSGVTMKSLTGDGNQPPDEKEIFKKQPPISLGYIDDSDSTGGKNLIGKINDVAKSISGVYTDQIKLFNDLHTNLDNTIKKLMDGQHDSLVKIDGKIFFDSLGTVPSDFQGSGSGSGS